MKDTTRRLGRIAIFSDLDERTLLALSCDTLLRNLDRGQVLAVEGQPCRSVYFVLEGRVRASKLSVDGREQILYDIGRDGGFYLVAALDGGVLPVTATAATRCSVLAVPAERFVALVDTEPSIARQLVRRLAKRLRHMSRLVEDLALRSVPARLARLLLDAVTVENPQRMTQREMAMRLGTVREVVARHLGRFRDSGLIRLQRGRIEIIDDDGLRSVADAGRE